MKLFSQSDVAKHLTLLDYVTAVENAHRAHGLGQIIEPNLLHAESNDGEFHIKIGGLSGERSYFGLKANGGFFENSRRHDLPNILGVIYLCDSENGVPLAILDSVAISRNRTAAATAVAAKYLARQDSKVLTVCGAGTQARVQIEALALVLPLEKVFVHGRNDEKVSVFAESCSNDLNLDVVRGDSPSVSIEASDVLVTCTPSRQSFVEREWIPDGMFIAAVGADSPGKQELAAEILAENIVVADVLHQVVNVGECQHAIAAGLLRQEDIHGQLGEIVCGQIDGRTRADQVIVYDSTGTALQDVAAAAMLYEKSLVDSLGLEFDLFA